MRDITLFLAATFFPFILSNVSSRLASGIPDNSLTREQARAEALKIVAGTVLETEEKKYGTVPVISVEIQAADAVHELLFRISDRSLLQNKLQEPHEASSTNKAE